MRIRKTKNLLYIFSSVMVLGLALISFDAPKPADSTVSKHNPTQAPEHTATPTPGPTQAPGHTATPTPTLTPTPTSTPTPTPTPSLAQLNAAIDIQPATDDIGTGLTTVITDYLNNYYSNEDLQVEEINNITCYYKEGLADVDYFVYVSYDISYKGSNVIIPAFEEYLVCIEGEAVTVKTEVEVESTDVKEALFLSRGTGSVCELHIKEMIRRFMNAKLAIDEELLASLVTDPSRLNLDSYRKKTEYIEEYKNLKYLIYKAPDEMTEFDYLVFLANDCKIVNISTLAAGLDEFIITLDENNYPKYFLGITSEAADNYRRSIREQETYQNFLETNVNIPLVEAMLSDPDLLEFIERIKNATDETE